MSQIDDLSVFFLCNTMFHNLEQEHQQRQSWQQQQTVNSESYLQVTVCSKVHYFDKHKSQWTTYQVSRVKQSTQLSYYKNTICFYINCFSIFLANEYLKPSCSWFGQVFIAMCASNTIFLIQFFFFTCKFYFMPLLRRLKFFIRKQNIRCVNNKRVESVHFFDISIWVCDKWLSMVLYFYCLSLSKNWFVICCMRNQDLFQSWIKFRCIFVQFSISFLFFNMLEFII